MKILKTLFGSGPKSGSKKIPSSEKEGIERTASDVPDDNRLVAQIEEAMRQVNSPSEPGAAEAAVLFDLQPWMDEAVYNHPILQAVLERLDKDKMKNGVIMAGDIPFENRLLYAVVIKSSDKQMVEHFIRMTGEGFSAKGLLSVESRHLISKDGNRISQALPVVETLEFKKGVAGDLAAERAGYESGAIQDDLKKRGWPVRKLHPPK